MNELSRLLEKGDACVLVTVARCEGSTPREPGAKMIVRSDGTLWGTIGGGRLEELATQDALDALDQRATRVIRYPLGPRAGQCCGGVTELLMEPMGLGPQLHVFGAGHVGQAIAQVLDGTPFTVHLVDEREEWIRHPAVPEATIRHAGGWDEIVRGHTWSKERSFAAVMTHRHDEDEEIVSALLRVPLRYLGLIGSQTKWARFQHRLEQRGHAREAIARVRSPIGLAIGGKTPREVAISVAAEVLREWNLGGDGNTSQ